MRDLLRGHGAPPMRVLPKGTRLYHVHEKTYAWDSFNPRSGGRYSLALTRHARAAYYVAASPEGALLEAIVRNREATPSGSIFIPRAVRQRWRLVGLETRQELKYLEIANATVRSLSSDERNREIWKRLGTTAHYPSTHEAAAQLLDTFEEVQAFGWYSAQSNPERVYLLHSPPWVGSMLRKVSSCSVDYRTGREALAAACASINYPLIFGP